ncbi:MAG: sigma-54-dependent transcriptional regulator [Gemmataceae bacterium]
MPTLLVIDDEQSVRYSFRRVFEGDDTKVLTARTATEGLKQLREQQPDVIVLDLQLPDGSGMDVFRDIQAIDRRCPVIFVTAHGSTETAIEAMKNGAFDYLVKPIDLDQLNPLLERAFEAARLMHSPPVLPEDEHGDRIIGRSAVMQEMCKTIGRIAPQDVNVLILGESGTGKELVARALYHHSNRADRPFLAINCAAIPETLLESELFGHEQGAFTGANRRRIGKFEQCDGGTLFLDEIGDMAPAVQAKILRVLQEQRFERLGSNETMQSSVRVLAATNHDLETLVEEGRFRKDLYYRLKVVTVQVPPLRERCADIPELAHYFLFRYARELNLNLRGLDPETLEILQSYHWPGNVRELQGVIKQAMLNATGHLLLPEFLPPVVFAKKPDTHHQAPVSSTEADYPGLQELIDALLQEGKPNLYAETLSAVERVLFTRVLQHTGGHQTKASELLGINRATFRTKLRALGMVIDKVVTCDSATHEDNGEE